MGTYREPQLVGAVLHPFARVLEALAHVHCLNEIAGLRVDLAAVGERRGVAERDGAALVHAKPRQGTGGAA